MSASRTVCAYASIVIKREYESFNARAYTDINFYVRCPQLWEVILEPGQSRKLKLSSIKIIMKIWIHFI